MFYLPESGQEHSAWCSLVRRYSVLSRGQKPHIIKGFILATFLYLQLLGTAPGGWVCWEQGYLCYTVRLPTTLSCSPPRGAVRLAAWAFLSPLCAGWSLFLWMACFSVPLKAGSCLQETFHEPYTHTLSQGRQPTPVLLWPSGFTSTRASITGHQSEMFGLMSPKSSNLLANWLF